MTRDEEWLLSEKYQGERSLEFFADCERLKNGEPLAYVIGHIPFLDTRIFLDSRPLIPRPETEFWVEDMLKSIGPNAHVLDLCAGSGCIGVAVLKTLPHSRVDFLELNTRHHPTIIRNLQENDILPSRARIFGGDLYEQVVDTYDFILSNPPYIDRSLNRTEASVLGYEPHDALFAEDKGLSLIKRIIENANDHLTQRGTLVIEHEPEQTEQMHKLGIREGCTCRTRKDQYGIERYTLFTREEPSFMAP